jgi:hypothetical protein
MDWLYQAHTDMAFGLLAKGVARENADLVTL